MPRQLTLERARAVVGYLERVDSYYAALEALSGAYVAYLGMDWPDPPEGDDDDPDDDEEGLGS